MKFWGMNHSVSSILTQYQCPTHGDPAESRRFCFSLPLPLPPSILSLSAPTIPVSLDVLTERSGLWHMSLTPTSYGHFLFCLCIEMMHRQGVGVGLQEALPSSLPTVQEERRCWEGGGEGCDLCLLEESLLLIPGRTCRGEGPIISFPDGHVWGSFEFLHIAGEGQRGGGGGGEGEGENGESMCICLWDALHFALPPTNCHLEKSHSGTLHWSLGPLPCWQALWYEANSRNAEEY